MIKLLHLWRRSPSSSSVSFLAIGYLIIVIFSCLLILSRESRKQEVTPVNLHIVLPVVYLYNTEFLEAAYTFKIRLIVSVELEN